MSPTSNETTQKTAEVDKGTLGLNVTIGISVSIALLIVIGVVASATVVLTVVIIRIRASRCLISERKMTSNATELAVGNGVGVFANNHVYGHKLLNFHDVDNHIYGAPDKSKTIDSGEDDNYFKLAESSYEPQNYSEVTSPNIQVRVVFINPVARRRNLGGGGGGGGRGA